MNKDNTNPIEQVASDERMSRKLFERLRWGDHPVCPHCSSTTTYKLTPKATSKHPVREGVYKCANCRKQFSVTVGTIFERSHIPLSIWIKAIAKLCQTTEGITSYALHRLLGVTYKSARLIEERLRYAITQPRLSSLLTREQP